MKSRLIHKFSRGQKHRILRALKRHGPLSVPELRREIPLSYMGVKQHCVELERDGLLLRKRKPGQTGRGRPEQLYELTAAAEEYFPSHDSPLTRQLIAALRDLYGTNAPEKVLFTIYQEKVREYRRHITRMLIEDRLRDFIRWREKEGYLLDLTPPSEARGWMVTECHSPLVRLVEEYPILLNFELQVYQKSLHPQTRRIRQTTSPYQAVFEIPLTSPAPPHV